VSQDRKARPWLDVLNGKHECGPSLSDYRDLELLHDGRTVRVSIPDELDDPDLLEIRATLGDDHRLVLIGHHTTKGDNPYERGVLMVARRHEDDGPYVVHVWHELYPSVLKYLGLEGSGIG
jgi:hypothetical protein